MYSIVTIRCFQDMYRSMSPTSSYHWRKPRNTIYPILLFWPFFSINYLYQNKEKVCHVHYKMHQICLFLALSRAVYSFGMVKNLY